jgi:allantoinase
MNRFDLLIRGGALVTTNDVINGDLAVAEEKIHILPAGQSAQAREIIDATGLHVFPGVIDSHVHFNEPGRAEWEGFETGSRAFAAGGGTLFFDMPLNSHPPTIDAASFDQKLRAAEASSLVDFAFWGGLVPGSVDRMEELAGRGVVGFKAFMANSGIEDFPRVDDSTLCEGMKRAAQLKKIVAVHAESEKITGELTHELLRKGKTSARDYLDSRPIHAELEAIARALEFAGETKCALHIVHVSCGAGITLVASAQKLGVDVSCETCPHYLVLTEQDVEGIGALAKCAPPLRPPPAQDALWEYLKGGQLTTVGSDHSPSPPNMKSGENFFKIWGGISGVQHTLPLLITEGYVQRHVELPILSRLMTQNVARRFRLPKTKGEIADGMDADLAIVDLKAGFKADRQDLHYRHKQTPYHGRGLTGKIMQTILRGHTVFKNDEFTSKPMGRLVRPSH